MYFHLFNIIVFSLTFVTTTFCFLSSLDASSFTEEYGDERQVRALVVGETSRKEVRHLVTSNSRISLDLIFPFQVCKRGIKKLAQNYQSFHEKKKSFRANVASGEALTNQKLM